MSGTNTMCVVTVLLETGMLPMTEPVTELTLEAPAGLIRVRAACRDGKVTGGHVPQRAGLRDAPRRRRSRSRTSGPSRSTWRTAGCSTSSPTPSAFGLRLTPDEGADIVRITEMIKAAANEQLPVVHPEQPGFAGITIGQLSGPGPRPGEQPAQRRHRLDRDARLGAAGDVDRRDRPLAVRDRDLGEDGDAPRTRRAARSATSSATRGSSARSSPAGSRRRRRSGSTGRSSRRSPARPGSPGFAELRRRPDRSVPRRLHGRRHLGLSASCAGVSAASSGG